MSYTTIKSIWPGEKVEDMEELRNSYGSAPVIWSALCRTYLGKDTAWLFDSAKLWPLYKRQDIPACLRAVLMMTFDRAYVMRKDYPRAAADIREFLRIVPQPEDHVNHWPRIAELFESDPDIPAIGLHCTSVSDDPFQGPYNEETDEYDPPNWADFWSVYDDPALTPLETAP